MSINWFLGVPQSAASDIRLFCLPYAGGSAGVYRPLALALAPDVEVRSVQLPGRGWRLGEAPLRDLELLAEQVAGAIAPHAGSPFALFGHSMGSWLALNVTRHLEDCGLHPRCLFASGRQAPLLGCSDDPMSHLDDVAFVERVQERYGGIPREVLEERELLALVLPALKADIALVEGYRHRPSRPVATPIHALVGEADDSVSPEELFPWSEETTGSFELTTLSGGHFYFQPDTGPLVELIRRRLLGAERAAGSGARTS